METRNVIIWLVVGLLVLAGGFLGGMLYSSMTNSPTMVVNDNGQSVPQVVADLSSKVIPSIAAYGRVSKIEGRNITLSYEGDEVMVLIRDDAKMYSFVSVAQPASGTKPPTTAPTTSSKQITFPELKVNDNVSVNLKIAATGTLEGFSVVVLPPPVTKTTPAPK